MKIALSGLDDDRAVLIEDARAVILAADQGASDGAAACFAHGDAKRLAQLAAVVLTSIRQRLGERAFAAVVRHASGSGAPEPVTTELPPAATLLADNELLRADNERLRELLTESAEYEAHNFCCPSNDGHACGCGCVEFAAQRSRALASPTGDRPNG